jgi:hypothetical protein
MVELISYSGCSDASKLNQYFKLENIKMKHIVNHTLLYKLKKDEYHFKNPNLYINST